MVVRATIPADLEPLGVVGPHDRHHPIRPAHAFHLVDPGLAAVARFHGEGGACYDEVGRRTRERYVIEEPADDLDVLDALVGQPGAKPPPERLGGLDGDHVAGPPGEIDREPSRPRAEFDGAIDRREPLQDRVVDRLTRHEPLVQLGLQAI